MEGSLISATATRAKIDGKAQGIDCVLAEGLAQIERTPRRDISADQDVCFQGVDRLSIAETK
jgi:hypothetical protein